MRSRKHMLPLVLLLAVVLAGLGTSGRFANAALQDGTPVAGDATPVATDDASPVAEPEGATEPATLVFAYAPDESGDFLVLSPLVVDGLVATPGEPEGDDEPGQVDFVSPRNDNLPWIRYGNNVFEAYAVSSEDPNTVERWIYYNEDPTLRPSTLVLQIVCVRGEYDGFEGTATFVSRGAEIGGTIVLALDPPATEE